VYRDSATYDIKFQFIIHVSRKSEICATSHLFL